MATKKKEYVIVATQTRRWSLVAGELVSCSGAHEWLSGVYAALVNLHDDRADAVGTAYDLLGTLTLSVAEHEHYCGACAVAVAS